MDFVDWCTHVLGKMVAARHMHPAIYSQGMDVRAVAALALPRALLELPGPPDAPQYQAIGQAVSTLTTLGFLQRDQWTQRFVETASAHEFISDPVRFWDGIAKHSLDEEEEDLLRQVNERAVYGDVGYALLTQVDGKALRTALPWAARFGRLDAAAALLDRLGLVASRPIFPSGMILGATYEGLVSQTKRSLTLESRCIDDLRVRGETANVEFKREWHIKTADEKAEFVKDTLALANTQVSADRWMIIGFDPKTLEYHGPPDPTVTRDRLEDLLATYTQPTVRVDYRVVNYRKGQVGKLQVLREPWHLPYRIAKSITGSNRKRRIRKGQVFVRRGSHNASAGRIERQLLDEEAERAKAASGAPALAHPAAQSN